MAIITNTARTAEIEFKGKVAAWGESDVLIPVAEKEAILNRLGEGIDPDFLIAFNPKEMANKDDDSKPYRVVFFH